MKGRLFREHCDDDGVTVNDFGGAEAGTSLRWIKTNVGRKNLDDAAQNMGGISDGSETTLGCSRGGGSRKLGSESIGGGKREAATSTCSSYGEARGSGIDANTTTASIQTRGPCGSPGESPAGTGRGRRDVAGVPITFVGG